jgi:hypothetical protein
MEIGTVPKTQQQLYFLICFSLDYCNGDEDNRKKKKEVHLLDLIAFGLADCIDDILLQGSNCRLYTVILVHELCREPTKHLNENIIPVGLMDHCDDAFPLLPSEVCPVEMGHWEDLFVRIELVIDQDHNTIESRMVSQLIRENSQCGLQQA